MLRRNRPATDREDWIGRPLRRREDSALVRGAGRFVGDLRPAGCLHLEFVRSPLPEGRIRRLGIDRARASPGVVAIFTGADTRHLPNLRVNELVPGLQAPCGRFMAETEVEAVGQPLVAVVAESAAAAGDAAALVEIDIDEPDAPAPLPGPAFTRAWRAGDPDAAFRDADHVIRMRIEHARLTAAPMEPRAALAEPDGERLTVWLSTQTPHRSRTELARILGLSGSDVRVIAPDVGGAFGGKASTYPEDVLVAYAALTLGRPVLWSGGRTEEFLSATQGRGGLLEGELALSRDGDFLALRMRGRFPLGHWMPFSGVVPALNAGRILPGPYRIAALSTAVGGHPDRTAAVNIYRGAGRPEAAMLLERLVDDGARRLGLDPIEIRRRNIVRSDEFPYRTASGEQIDSGDFERLLARARQRSGYPDLLATRDRVRAAGRIFGIGVALYVEPCGQGWESAHVRLAPDGTIVAATGSGAQGQGRETAFAQIVADAMSVSPDRVHVVHGDTATAPNGIGALASRSTAIGGSALSKAAAALSARARAIAAEQLQTDAERIVQDEDGFMSIGGGGRFDWAGLAATAAEPLEEACVFETPGEAWSSGCCIAAVEIDADTGAPAIQRIVWVDDAGTVVNPMLVEGQLLGGLAQGLGEALMERLSYDAAGQLVTASFMDYAIPRAGDIPPVDLDSLETPSPLNALGAKGVGEAGCIGVPAAIVNAAIDALAPFGIRHLDMPLTSAKLWHALRAGTEQPR